ncbi:hypothetical protein CDAR_523411 [Caerostris darwini]|uniref:Uncharacterized protein n=1 Tax=Caerostris darwini TaxID=1538125 RepID=A0AAV4QRH6_9ARAC|nr:hypothetical protein CDAR_523411 [Caerostris darwini]
MQCIQPHNTNKLNKDETHLLTVQEQPHIPPYKAIQRFALLALQRVVRHGGDVSNAVRVKWLLKWAIKYLVGEALALTRDLQSLAQKPCDGTQTDDTTPWRKNVR